jgi:Rrf2 family nitric oxide-sensitive transcriptional repressor
LTPDCRLKHLFGAALRGYFQALDGATLADLTSGPPGPDSISEGPAMRGKRAVAVTMPTSTRPLRQAKAPARGR